MEGRRVVKKKRSPFLRGCFISFLIIAAIPLGLIMAGKIGNLFMMAKDSIGVIPIEGVITSSKEINEELRRFGKNKRIKGVVLRINSPGGGVGPSQEIYEEVKKLKGKKAVIASIGAVGASGGYYIACGADRIIADPGSITGSIGVIIEFVNLKDLVEKLGVRGMVVKSGPMKDVGNPMREMTQEERTMVQELINNIYNQFVDAVADGRKIERTKVLKMADGRIFSGEQAKGKGLVDFLGNFYDAVDIVSQMVGIKGEPNIVYPPKKKISIIELIKGEVESIIGQVMSETVIPKFVTR